MLMTDAPAVAGRREWTALAVIALPCLLYSMDLSVLYLALPSLTADLHPSGTQLLWISDIYGFTLAGFLITMGTLGDRIGRRRLLLIGAAVFGAASVLAAFATSAAMLIAARALLGLAASTLAPSTLSLIRNMFRDSRQRATAIAIWVTSFSAGAVLGPALGGMLLHFFWWGAVFLIAVPVMVLLLAVGPALLPEFRDPRPGRFDLVSAALSLVSVLAIVYAVTDFAAKGAGPVPLFSFLAGSAAGLAFVHRQYKLTEPLVSPRLFRRSAFTTALAANTLSLFLIFGTFFLTAQYLQLVIGFSPLRAGLWSVLPPCGFFAGSLLAPALMRRHGAGMTMAGGLAVAALGLSLLTQVPGHGGRGLPLTLAASALLTVGVSPVVTLATDLIVGAVPPEHAGQASGLSETGTELGGALGIALLGSITTAVFHTRMDGVVTAGPRPPTLAAAAHAAATLPGSAGASLLSAARDAFTQGLHIAAATSALLALMLAVLAAATLRQRGRTAAETGPSPAASSRQPQHSQRSHAMATDHRGV
jgi:DHA2 family multidrug resistance protein-like MFS transporter